MQPYNADYMESPFIHFSGLLRAIGLFLSGVCHQLPEHTLTTAAGQMPLCARCTGTYWGAAFTFVLLSRQRHARASRLPRATVMLFLAGLSLLWLIDGINSYLNFVTGRVWLYLPNNALRLATGLGFGLALGSVVWPLFNESLWKELCGERVLSSWRELRVALFGITGLWLVFFAGGSLPGWLVALLETIVVVLVLTVVNTMVALVALRRENRADEWRDVRVPLGLGLLLAVSEVAGIALLRHLLARTLP